MSTLGYWKIRGFVQPIRYMLEYVGEEYDDVMYQQGEAPDFSRECWLKEKYNLGLDFPNLPYYLDGKVKLTQSGTILKYLARKHDLDVCTEEERLKADLVMDEMVDFRNGFSRLCYNPKYETLREDYSKTWLPRIQALETYLGNRTWFTGEKLTYVDFLVYECVSTQRALDLGLYDNTPKLDAFSRKFEELKGIREYLASGRRPNPICNKIAAAFTK